MMGLGLWGLEFIQLAHDFIEIRGWAVAPEGDCTVVSFAVNDKEFDQIDYSSPRADVGQIFWYIPNSWKSGFVCRAYLSTEEVFANGYAVFKFINSNTGLPFNEKHNYYYCDPLADKPLLPDSERRKRVHGNEDEITFRLEGYSTYMKLKLAMRRLFGRDYGDFSRILDWGCGCGRMTRYFKDLKWGSITGVDIDADNVNWCQQHLNFGRFLTIPLHPPTNLNDSSFDLLIGISVFAHLREGEQYEWLSELRRIASEEAILLMSVHGGMAVCRSNFLFSLFEAWKTRGFLDVGPNPDLDGVIGEQDYYRNTFHTSDYVRENWSKYFEIVDIMPGYVGNLQDLVIMRKV